MKRTHVPLKELEKRFLYNPETGSVVWKIAPCNGILAGSTVGCINGSGYLITSVNKARILVHRVAWILYHQQTPPDIIDHANGNKLDNRISNLREASALENRANCIIRKDNTTGVKGVVFHRQTGKWWARITNNGKCRSLGLFSHIDDARIAYEHAARSDFGSFALHTRD